MLLGKLSTSIYDLVLIYVCHFHHHFLLQWCLVKYYHYRDTRAYILDPCIQGIFINNSYLTYFTKFFHTPLYRTMWQNEKIALTKYNILSNHIDICKIVVFAKVCISLGFTEFFSSNWQKYFCSSAIFRQFDEIMGAKV